MELTIADLKPLLPGLEAVLDDEAVSEVMVTEPAAVFVERAGRLAALDAPALTADAVARAAIQIARLLGEDPATDPIIDAQSGRRLARTPLAWQILYRALPESLDTGCVGTLLRRTERATLSDPAPHNWRRCKSAVSAATASRRSPQRTCSLRALDDDNTRVDE